MDEVYTCVCKGQAWSIHDGFIRCLRCRKKYKLKDATNRDLDDEIESPKDFNIRVKEEG